MTVAEQYRELPVASIERNPDQPRRHFDAEGLRELGQSIRDQGLLQAIVVRPLPADLSGEERYVIVAGERRWRAHQAVGLTAIQARVLPEMGDTEAYTLSVLENVTRRDMGVLEESGAYRTLRDAGRTVSEIAAATGKGERWVQVFLDLENLCPELEHLVGQGGMTVGVAWSASRCSHDGQRVLLRKYLAGEFPRDSDCQAFASALLMAESQESLWDTPEDEAAQARTAKARAGLAEKLDRVAVAAYVLDGIGAMEPDEVARLLAGHKGGAAAHRDRVRDVVAAANRALSVLRRAAAISEAHQSLTQEESA